MLGGSYFLSKIADFSEKFRTPEDNNRFISFVARSFNQYISNVYDNGQSIKQKFRHISFILSQREVLLSPAVLYFESSIDTPTQQNFGVNYVHAGVLTREENKEFLKALEITTFSALNHIDRYVIKAIKTEKNNSICRH